MASALEDLLALRAKLGHIIAPGEADEYYLDIEVQSLNLDAVTLPLDGLVITALIEEHTPYHRLCPVQYHPEANELLPAEKFPSGIQDWLKDNIREGGQRGREEARIAARPDRGRNTQSGRA